MSLKVGVRGFFSKRGRIVVFGMILLSIASSIILILGEKSKMPSIPAEDTLVLALTDFTDSISATGTVESAESTFIYSSLPNQIKEVYAEVGDYVEEGELLAKLDDRNIKEQIESQEINLSTATAGSAQSIKVAKDNYDQFKYALDNGLNAGINGAQSQVDQAYDNYRRAVKTYERYRDELDAEESAPLHNLESTLNNARIALNRAQEAYDEALKAANTAYGEYQEAKEALEGQEDEGMQTELGEKLGIYNAAQAAADLALQSLNSARAGYDLAWSRYRTATSADQALSDYAEAVESAERAYEDARTNLKAARLAAENQLKSYADALKSARINADNSGLQASLRQLKVTLDSTRITAPLSGTVTAVYATTGMAGSGLLFIIENIDDLVVESSVKEYDIGMVEEGMPVTIKSNATGNDIYEGIIISIAPTSNKTAQGKTDTSGEVEFKTKVKVTTPKTRLRVGMNVRLNYIVEQQPDVLSVPYDTIYTNEKDETCILVLEKQPGGTFLIKEQPVTTDLENDLEITIGGSGVMAGLRVIGNPETYRSLAGREVKVTE